MPEENLEHLIAAWIDAYNAGDMDRMLTMLDPDFEYISSGEVPGTRPAYRGHAEWRDDFWRDWRKMWETLRIEPAEQRVTGNRIVSLYTFEARARDGMEVSRRFSTLTTVRDGLIVRMQSYGDWSTALKAAGLGE